MASKRESAVQPCRECVPPRAKHNSAHSEDVVQPVDQARRSMAELRELRQRRDGRMQPQGLAIRSQRLEESRSVCTQLQLCGKAVWPESKNPPTHLEASFGALWGFFLRNDTCRHLSLMDQVVSHLLANNVDVPRKECRRKLSCNQACPVEKWSKVGRTALRRLAGGDQGISISNTPISNKKMPV